MADTKSKSNAQMLADALESMRGPFLGDGFRTVRADEIAAELRRLDAVEKERDALADSCAARADRIDRLGEAIHDWRIRSENAEAERDALKQANEEFAKRQEWWNAKMFEAEAERDALRAEVERMKTAAGRPPAST